MPGCLGPSRRFFGEGLTHPNVFVICVLCLQAPELVDHAQGMRGSSIAVFAARTSTVVVFAARANAFSTTSLATTVLPTEGTPTEGTHAQEWSDRPMMPMEPGHLRTGTGSGAGAGAEAGPLMQQEQNQPAHLAQHAVGSTVAQHHVTSVHPAAFASQLVDREAPAAMPHADFLEPQAQSAKKPKHASPRVSSNESGASNGAAAHAMMVHAMPGVAGVDDPTGKKPAGVRAKPNKPAKPKPASAKTKDPTKPGATPKQKKRESRASPPPPLSLPLFVYLQRQPSILHMLPRTYCYAWWRMPLLLILTS